MITEIVFNIDIIVHKEDFSYKYHRKFLGIKALFSVGKLNFDTFLRCNYLDDKWIIRFAALDRLGGCTNVMEKRRSASISTSITTCKTVFVSGLLRLSAVT